MRTERDGVAVNASVIHPEGSWSRRLLGTGWWVAGQLALLFTLFQIYKIVRKTFLLPAEEVAFANALQILRWQERLGINIELDLQRRVLEHEGLIWFFNRYYSYFTWAFYLSAACAMVANPRGYRWLRRVFFVTMLLALPWYVIYPLAPPRFMEQYGYPFVDTLAVYGPKYFSETGIVQGNRFAAMPSMHIGWTVVAGFMLAVAFRRWRLGTVLGALHVALMCVTVVVTGNHYVLDIVGGLLLDAAAFGIVALLPTRLPLPWNRFGARPSPARSSVAPPDRHGAV
ncbi:MAG: phosphatase PAP2 family protein [Chloroflexota bacterium]|nr:phosphatase PAP2 family protein [Chloroflexota bacterium]